MTRSLIERRIHISALLVASGLVIQILTQIWSHPLAFIAFLLIGTPLVAAGALLYLYSLVRGNSNSGSDRIA